ncbi:DUF2157 domain-containing protein [Actinokineospora xionganensis]|uniref:DUF2157 domain-containing protein n=1 Tax=Actinokineospora xionganensis TaxID=2684470 RepID=A0ABR7KZL4_9PSEU|nr:hypothetical protein [Actinokineospora xionganensis]MBC6445871.1 hypothetical protein [Actinokineospora xionganensis]
MAGTASKSLTREQDAALRKLGADGLLTDVQVDAVLAALRAGRVTATEPRRVAEILGYLGGALMLAGASLLVGTSWEDLTRPGRIAVLALAFTILASAGVLAAHGRVSPARTRVSGVLLALSAVVGALTAGTIATGHEGVWAAGAAFLLALCGYLYVPSLAGIAVAAISGFALVSQVIVDLLAADSRYHAGALIALGLGWGVSAWAGAVRPAWAGFTVAAGIALLGAQQPLGMSGWEPWAYGLTAGIAVLCFATYPLHRSPVLLAAGVLGVTIAVPEAIWDWTGGTVGGAAIVLIAGAVLLVMGALSLRVRH